MPRKLATLTSPAYNACITGITDFSVATDFVQRQINRLLEQAGEAIVQLDWQVVNQRAQAVLALDPENADGLAL